MTASNNTGFSGNGSSALDRQHQHQLALPFDVLTTTHVAFDCSTEKAVSTQINPSCNYPLIAESHALPKQTLCYAPARLTDVF